MADQSRQPQATLRQRSQITTLRVATIRDDAKTTELGISSLAGEVCWPANQCKAISMVCAVQLSDGSIVLRKYGRAERNADHAHRLAAQLVDSLIWD